MAEASGLLIIGSVVKGATSALVSKYSEKVLTPFLRGLSSVTAHSVIKRNTFRYIKNVEYRTRTLPSIAIPSGVFSLEEVYEPLSVKGENDGGATLIDAYPRDLFANARCIAITDDAGMGKSTLAKFIVRSAIKEQRNIPLLVELRRLRVGGSIIDSLCQDLAGGASDSPAGVELIKLFASGNFLFVFDGYDELDEEVRAAVTEEVNRLAGQFVFCYFLLTSRKEYGAALFPEFAHYEICKLTKEQAHSLIKRYDQNRGIAKALIKQIDEADVGDFLGNPLLVTLLYKAFDYRPTIPPKRGIFFRQVYEALFQDHDLSKGGSFERKKQCGLDVDDFHRFMRALGFITFRSGRVSYSPEEFCQHLEAAVERSALSVDWQKIKADLIRAVPIFVKDGVDFRWSHKSFQEYFAALHIIHDLGGRRAEALQKMFVSEQVLKFREVLRFIAEADIAMIHDVCIEPLLSSIYRPGMTDDEFLLELTFSAADVFYVGELGEGFNFSNPRAALQDRVKAVLGVDVAGRPSRVFTRRSDSYGVLVSLKPKGAVLVMLPLLDPDGFALHDRFGDLLMYGHWKRELAKTVKHMNPTIRDQFAMMSGSGGAKSLAAAVQVPSIPVQKYIDLVGAKTKRAKAVEALILDGF